MIKITKYVTVIFAFAALSLCGAVGAFAADAAKQLEKGKALFAEKKDSEAMDYFIDVMLGGTPEQSEEANHYVNLIHNRMAGIQTPVEVDVNFQEGKVRHAGEGDPSEYYGTKEQEPYTQADEDAAEAVAEEDDAQDAQEDLEALGEENEEETAAAEGTDEISENDEPVDEEASQETDSEENADESAYSEDEEAASNDGAEAAAASGTFDELTSGDALQARELYTQQKVQSMKDAAIAKIRDTKGVRLYFRNGQPDAIDMDGDVIFEGNKFKTSALPLLDEIYSLMALTQGASYVILPPGSYTDDVSLPGIRQAMALNSFFVHKGISSGKISYNMGLYDQEPPAKFANLEGLSIVFDYEADLPAQISQATSISNTPLLSMAVVPVSNTIDMAAGEAFVIDFSVVEAGNPIENWVFQIVQHAADGKYYVVRQLEGFAPVYHQILWNGRKGVIGPELQSGKYTLVLTATDVKGEKRTLRRAVQVTGTAVKETKAAVSAGVDEASICPKCNYKTARLWKKPGRVMKASAQTAAPAAVNPAPTPEMPDAQPDLVDPFEDMPDTVSGTNDAASAYPAPAQGDAYADPAGASPYDMPYEETSF